jgi:hypothetical protein
VFLPEGESPRGRANLGNWWRYKERFEKDSKGNLYFRTVYDLYNAYKKPDLFDFDYEIPDKLKE